MKSNRAVVETLFPKVRAALLRALFAGEKQEYYVRELVMHTGLALGTVQQELAKLSRVGLITSWSNGYQRFYRASREHPLFSSIRNIVQPGSLPSPARVARKAKSRSSGRTRRAGNSAG